MDYNGQVVDLPVGQDGLRTDDPHNRLPLGTLVRAINVNLQAGKIEKDFGSRRWSTQLPAAIKAGIDFWPDTITQRMVLVCSDGKVYKLPDYFTQIEVTPTGGAPATLNPSLYSNIVIGGAEETGNARKLFIFTGVDPVQVISGDSNTRHTIARPAADWTGLTHPIGGIVYGGRMHCWLPNSGTVYVSSATDHEDFTTSPLLLQTDSDGEGVRDAFIHNKILFFVKYPGGLYAMNVDDPSAPYLVKVDNSIGTPSVRCCIPAFTDVAIANQFGGISSLTSVAQFGDVKTSDLFAQLRVQQFVREEISADGVGIRQGIYYPDRKTLMFVYRSKTSIMNDRICYVDLQDPLKPKVVWNDKDQPNCLFLVKDLQGVQRPFYGAEDRFVYQMDQVDRWVGSSNPNDDDAEPYRGEFWTPHMDFGLLNQDIANDNKLFDFLELMFEPAGDFQFMVDVFIDGRKHTTLRFDMGSLNDMNRSTAKMDTMIMDPLCLIARKLPIKATGKRIQLRCYNAGLGENFKICGMKLYVGLGGGQDRKQ